MKGLAHIGFFLLFITCETAVAQVCPKDSNFYSINYNGFNNTKVVDGLCLTDNEVVTLNQYSIRSSFVTKYTGDGSVIWSNDYEPNYPFINSATYPWYNQTEFRGIVPGDSATFYLYGSAYEHGRSINNVEEPAGHWVGLLLHIDGSGNVLNTTYFGNWGTSYTLNGLSRLPNGNMLVYLRSQIESSPSRVICINKNADILWGTNISSLELYYELDFNVLMRQMTNGHVVVGRSMGRDIADTLVYPFLIVILPAPLTYFHFFELDTASGKVLWESSLQCPMIYGTNVPQDYRPILKNISEMPDGSASFLADIYLPDDDLVPFWNHLALARRTANIILDKNGYFNRMIAYALPGTVKNVPMSLEFARPSGTNGDQIFLSKSTADQSMILSKLNNQGDVLWTKGYKHSIPNDKSTGVAVERQNAKGYFVFESEEFSLNYHLSITNVLGNDSCDEVPATLVREDLPWPWPSDKIHMLNPSFFVDIRHSPTFAMSRKSHPVGEQITCQYEQTCCKDVIDSVNQHNISLCEGELYTLPGNKIVRDSGQYYVTEQTTRGCDSITYYNVKILKSPSHMVASPDTCLNESVAIQLSATAGYESYWWDNVSSESNTYEVHSVGTYQVRVENVCGSKTDTVQVFDHCNFPVYFPTAFTPNGDMLNDILRVPPQNKNNFKRLAIFNRWGQIIFQTTNQSEGWDGKWNGILQPTGVYVYFLEMKGLSGQPVSQKGTVTLIR